MHGILQKETDLSRTSKSDAKHMLNYVKMHIKRDLKKNKELSPNQPKVHVEIEGRENIEKSYRKR